VLNEAGWHRLWSRGQGLQPLPGGYQLLQAGVAVHEMLLDPLTFFAGELLIYIGGKGHGLDTSRVSARQRFLRPGQFSKAQDKGLDGVDCLSAVAALFHMVSDLLCFGCTDFRFNISQQCFLCETVHHASPES
jgi:hypothetical protein